MKQIATQIPEDIYEKLHKYAKKSGIKIWRIIADALTDYFNKTKQG